MRTTKTTEKPTPKKPEKKSVVRKPAPKKPKITYPELRQGAQGDLVDQLQMFLRRDGSNVKISGVFNGGTMSAVRAFQKRHDLPVTGIVDSATWAALIKIK